MRNEFAAAPADDVLEIEFIDDTAYRQNTIYRSWHDILAGGTNASPDRPVPEPVVPCPGH
jgi:hypothetical protein